MILSNGAVLPNNLETLGDITPLFADASYWSTSALALNNEFAAYGALYRAQLWVGIVVRKRALGTARLPFDVKRQGQANSQEPEPGPMAELLKKPNSRMSGFKLWNWTCSTRDIYGEAFWLKVRDDKKQVRELRPMHPRNVIVRRSQDNGEIEFVYSSGVRNASQLPPIPADDVVAFTSYNPDNMERGVSNLEGLRMTLWNEDASRRATASFWAKGARPSVILTHPANLSAPAQERLKASWEASQSGADNMGGTAVLEEGIKAQVVQLNSEEMQYIQSRQLNREEICAAFDVPPPVVHILDHATYSNITEQLRSMYRDTMTLIFEDFESVIDNQLVPDFYKPADGIFTHFNMDEVLRGDFESRASAVTGLVDHGIMTPQEARPMFGLPPADAVADRLYANAAMQPLGTPSERISITAAVPASPAQSAEATAAEGNAAGNAIADAQPVKALNTRAIKSAVGRAFAEAIDQQTKTLELTSYSTNGKGASHGD